MHTAANWPFCPLCQRWGCWWLWSSWDPKCPSSRSCLLFACKQSQPRQIKRCVCSGGKYGVMWASVSPVIHRPSLHLEWTQTEVTNKAALVDCLYFQLIHRINKCRLKSQGSCLTGTLTEQLTPPVLLPLVHAGDYAHFTVAFRSTVGDQRLILKNKRGCAMINKANKAGNQHSPPPPHRVWPFLWPMYL